MQLGFRRQAGGLSCLALAAGLLLGSVGASAQQQAHAAGRLLVMPRAGLPSADLDRIVGAHGGKARRVGGSDLHIVDLPPQVSETAILNLLARHPHLKFAELDQRVGVMLAGNDPYLGSEWHIGRIGAPSAWDASQGSGITIAILDSGVLATHPDLSARLVPGWNFYDNNANTADVFGHGTAVAGAAAATINNGAGVAGVAGAARIMPIRVADSTGYAYYSTIAQGVTYAADNGARVANASFSGAYGSSSIQSAAQYLKSKGGLLVVSAGNSATNDGSPASTTLIPVSATDSNDALASFSSFGSYVAVSAPGVGIWTTGADGGYRAVNGTSFAAPITAGVIALMMAAKPSLPASQIESLLYATAVDLGAAGRDIYFGHGRVNAAAAVAAAAAAAVTDTQAPSVAIVSPSANASLSGLALVDVSATDNVGVSRVELRVNGSTLASDTAAPYQFSWNTAAVANGSATLTAVAYDAAGNSRTSTGVTVTVANGVVVDTTAPVVAISNPVAGKVVSGTVQIAAAASDNSGAAGIRQSLYIDGKLKASATGGSLSYSWNTRKESAGTHTVQVVAQDAAGNTGSTSVQVTR